ncbi:hypothetical protein DLH72_04975 [Candidatus Gracilibacteria bacterium]|nr:MAG: hypothetical protein DLH72_04975 [Candidatus Gracilibacteria bacterium]
MRERNFGIFGIIGVLIFVFGIIGFFAFSEKIPVGFTGIKVNLYGEGKGAEPQGLHTGRNFYNPFTNDIFIYPIFIQQKNFEAIKFQDKDGLSITADIGVDYKFDETKIGKIYAEYKAGVEKITNEYMSVWLKNSVNSISSTYEIDSLYGKDKEKFRLEILEKIKADLSEKGIIINNVYFTSEISLPEQVKDRINSKIEATQNAMQKENELRAVKAEAQKKIEEAKGIAESERIKAQGIADANKLKEKSLTPEILEFEKIQKWDGKLPTYTGGATPFINLK